MSRLSLFLPLLLATSLTVFFDGCAAATNGSAIAPCRRFDLELTGTIQGQTQSRIQSEADQTAIYFGITLLLTLLVISFLVGHCLELRHVHWLHESAFALILGIIMGAVIHFAGASTTLNRTISFNVDFFFLFLLPPIIFESGFNMKRRTFFRNIFPICMLAFVGTIVSMIGTALLIYVAGFSPSIYSLSLVESLTFGALISATDPVTTLAIFQSVHADVDLYAIVFGESVLNDAVGTALYETMASFNPDIPCENGTVTFNASVPPLSFDVTGCNVTVASTLADVVACQASPSCSCPGLATVDLAGASSVAVPYCAGRDPVDAVVVFSGIGRFLLIFFGSLAIGAVVGVAASITYKLSHLHKPEFLTVEIALLVLFPYISWMIAQGLDLSGIVAILFCGIVMAHYCYNNLSAAAQDHSRRLFKIVATLAELFIFIYLGLALFSFDEFWDCSSASGSIGQHVSLIVVTIVICFFTRILNVLPNMAIVNIFRPKHHKINGKFQLVIWYSGLRGAMAFALSVKAMIAFTTNGVMIMTLTIFVVIVTVLFIGGGTSALLTKLDVRERSAEEDANNYDGSGLLKRGGGKSSESSFAKLDRRFLRRVLTRTRLDTSSSSSSRHLTLELKETTKREKDEIDALNDTPTSATSPRSPSKSAARTDNDEEENMVTSALYENLRDGKIAKENGSDDAI